MIKTELLKELIRKFNNLTDEQKSHINSSNGAATALDYIECEELDNTPFEENIETVDAFMDYVFEALPENFND